MTYPLPLSEHPVNAADVANFTRLWTTTDLDSLNAAGVIRLIVGGSYGPIARQQLEVASADARFDVQAYAFVEFGDIASATLALDRCLAAMDGLPVSRCWLDCEAGVAGWHPVDVLARIQWAIDYLKAHRPDLALGIYSARWWWDTATGSSHETFGLPLMYACYNRNGFQWEHGEAFGGWAENEVYMKQFAGSVPTCGLNTDQSIITEFDPMFDVYSKSEVDAKVNALFMNAVQNGKDILAHGAAITFLCDCVVSLATAGAHTPEAIASLNEQVASIKAEQDALEARVKAASASFA